MFLLRIKLPYGTFPTAVTRHWECEFLVFRDTGVTSSSDTASRVMKTSLVDSHIQRASPRAYRLGDILTASLCQVFEGTIIHFYGVLRCQTGGSTIVPEFGDASYKFDVVQRALVPPTVDLALHQLEGPKMRREIRRADSPPSYETQRCCSPNVLIVGETGVGKSSVVNLIAGDQLATVDSGAGACTMQATSYDIILPDHQGLSHHIRLFDTVGLNEPQFRKNDYLKAIEQANALICELQRTGGIRLLLFCFRGGRITAVMQNNYRLFRYILCQDQVPVAFIITGLENEPSMEGWWSRNVSLFDAYGLTCASHACITAIPGLNGCFVGKYRESQMAVHALLLAHVAGDGSSWRTERTGWYIHLAGKLLRWISQIRGRRRQVLTMDELTRHLQGKCNFSRLEAEYLATKIWAKRLENAGPDFVKSDDVSIDS